MDFSKKQLSLDFLDFKKLCRIEKSQSNLSSNTTQSNWSKMSRDYIGKQGDDMRHLASTEILLIF